MIDVKRPVLLDAALNPVRTLNAKTLSLTFNSPGVSQATMTLPPDEPEPGMHTWVSLYNQNGFAGVYRVTTPSTDFFGEQSITLRHGIDVLADAVCAEQGDFTGTVAQLLTKILGYQTQKVGNTAYWTLGDCADTNTLKYSLNYDKLSELLTKIEEDEPGYAFVYDQTAFPWVLHFRAKPANVDTEFRISRNVRTISRTYNDNELCTQLILSVNSTSTATISPKTVESGSHGDYSSIQSDSAAESMTAIKIYNNTAAQAIYGIVQKTADIDTHDNLSTETWPEADAWAAKFLAERSAPTAQIQISGDEFNRVTGDTWDESKIGHICRVPLPEKGVTITERAVTITYPDALGDPGNVTISLAAQLPRFSSGIATLRKESASTAASARASARAVSTAAKEKDLKTWSMIVKEQQLALDGTGITQLYETGIDMDAQGGVLIYSINQGMQSLYSGIQVQAGRIDLVVQGEGSSASIRISAIVDGINEPGSTVQIDADHIALDANRTITLSSKLGIEANTGFLTVTGSERISGDLYVAGFTSCPTVRIGSRTEVQGEETGEFFFRGDQYYDTVMYMGVRAGVNNVLVKNILSKSNSEISLNHAHAVTMQEITSGEHAGEVQATIGDPVASDSSSRISFFDIATSVKYLSDVAAARIQGRGDVTVGIVDGNNNAVSGQRMIASSITLYPAKYIGGTFDSKNTAAAVVISPQGGSDTISCSVIARYSSGDVSQISSSGGTTKWRAGGAETTEIFENSGPDQDMRNKVSGYYVFKITCGSSTKYYGFWVGARP